MNQGRIPERGRNCKGGPIDKAITLGNWGIPEKWNANTQMEHCDVCILDSSSSYPDVEI